MLLQVPAGFDRPQDDEEGFSALGAARDSSSSKRVTLRLYISSTEGSALQEVRITAAAPPGVQVLEVGGLESAIFQASY
jgi:hypothetical protein